MLYSENGRTVLTIDDMNSSSDAFPGWKNSLSETERGMTTNMYTSPQNEVLYIDPTTKAAHRYVMKNHKYIEQSGGEQLLLSLLSSFDTRYLIYVGDGAEPKYVVLEGEACSYCRVHEKKDNRPHLVLLGNSGGDHGKSRKQLVEEAAVYACQSGKDWYEHMTVNAPLKSETCGKDAAWYANQELIGLIRLFNPSKTKGTPSVNVVPMSIGSVWWKNMQKSF